MMDRPERSEAALAVRALALLSLLACAWTCDGLAGDWQSRWGEPETERNDGPRLTLALGGGFSGSLANEALDGYAQTEFRGNTAMRVSLRYGRVRGPGLRLSSLRFSMDLMEPPMPAESSGANRAAFSHLATLTLTTVGASFSWAMWPDYRPNRGILWGYCLDVGFGYTWSSFKNGSTLNAIAAESGVAVGSKADGVLCLSGNVRLDLFVSKRLSLFAASGLMLGRNKWRLFFDTTVGEVPIKINGRTETPLNLHAGFLQFGVAIDLAGHD